MSFVMVGANFSRTWWKSFLKISGATGFIKNTGMVQKATKP